VRRRPESGRSFSLLFSAPRSCTHDRLPQRHTFNVAKNPESHLKHLLQIAISTVLKVGFVCRISSRPTAALALAQRLIETDQGFAEKVAGCCPCERR
jgi:hypothetical protein